MRRTTLLVLILPLIGAACSDAPSDNPLYTDPLDHEFSDNPDLLQRITRSPHDYFRFVSVPFAREVCRRFDSAEYYFPDVNLHGDAHVEQYAVTANSRGLSDFDRACIGLSVIDLVRFSSSLRLACRDRGWQEHEERICAAFLDGYLQSLRQPDLEHPEPELAGRIRRTFAADRGEQLADAQRLMTPLDLPLDTVRHRMADYVAMVLAENPDLSAEYFTIKTAGSLKIGIGSALDEKHLVRIEGPSPAEEDDVLLEIKEVRSLTGVGCIRSTRPNDPLRILLGESRLAYDPDPYIGYVLMQAGKQPGVLKNFWIRAWDLAYREVSIRKSLDGPGDLSDLARDVGVQLGLGHPRDLAAPHERKLRAELDGSTTRFRATIEECSRDLTGLTLQAWERFCHRAGFE